MVMVVCPSVIAITLALLLAPLLAPVLGRAARVEDPARESEILRARAEQNARERLLDLLLPRSTTAIATPAFVPPEAPTAESGW